MRSLHPCWHSRWHSCWGLLVLALLAGPCSAANEAALAASAPEAAASQRLGREDDDSALSAFGKAMFAMLAVAGAGVAVVQATRRRGGAQAAARQARLNAVAHLRLSPKCTLHLVEADGQAVLVVAGDGASAIKLASVPARENA